jgi:SagB-type dehydrogenase family enzyme
MAEQLDTIKLPEPVLSGKYSLAQALQHRRSVREYLDAKITLPELGQLLWAAQGITDKQGLHTAPSAGALYPLELYVVANNVDGLSAGVYQYHPRNHRLTSVLPKELSQALSRAALGQDSVREAAAVVVFTAIYRRTTKKYGKRGERYVHIETGHAAENLFLQAQALGLGTVDVGAFDDDDVARLLELPDDVKPILLMPVGRVQRSSH